MSVFSRLERMVSRSVDRLNAERFRLLPMKASADPNGRRVADPGRPIVEGRGIYDTRPAEFGIEFGARRVGEEANDLVTASSGQRPVLSVNVEQFPANGRPRQGDVIELLDRADHPPMRVIDVQPDGEGRLELRLARLG